MDQRAQAIDEEMARLTERQIVFDPAEIAISGVFVSLDSDGTLYLDNEKADGAEAGAVGAQNGGAEVQRAVITVGGAPSGADMADDEEEEIIKPLPDRLVSELTAHRTLALQDALAGSPSMAFAAVLHAMVLSTFYFASRESCVGVSISKVSFAFRRRA